METINLKSGYEIIVDDEDFERVSQFNWYVQKYPNRQPKVFRWINKSDGWHGTRIWLSDFLISNSLLPIKHVNNIWNDFRKENLRVIKKIKKPKSEKNKKSKEEIRLRTLKQMMYRRLFDENFRYSSRIYRQNKFKTNIHYKIKQTVKSRIHCALKSKGLDKKNRTQELIGCSIQEFMSHIEQRFVNGMTWENHGKYWEIDHIIPCAWFNLENENELKECFSYKNCQPLKIDDNRSKSDSLCGISIRSNPLSFK